MSPAATRETTRQSVNFLERFNRQLNNEDEYWQACQYLLHGGWGELIRQYFYQSPNWKDEEAFAPLIIMPGDELGASRIEPIPTSYEANLTIGDLLIRTAWARGLSPRLLTMNPSANDYEMAIKFVPRHPSVPYQIGSPPSVDLISKMLLHPEVEEETQVIETPRRGKMLQPLLEELKGREGKFSAFDIEASDELKYLFVRLKEKLVSKSLVEILDILTHHLDAIWEWGNGGKIHIVPTPGSATVKALLGRRS